MNRWSAVTLLLVLVLSCLSIYALTPPRAVPATAPATAFSAERAMQHLRTIAQKPRPSGTAENARVRTYLIEQLQALGLTPVTQSTDPVAVVNSLVVAGPVTNVMARLPGTDSTGAILLVGHFDTSYLGPGAGDDGASVAALLETIRALKAGPLLRNDVIFLFTDGEERCMLGAAAFAAEHPWAHDVGLAFNFDNRGISGADWMFETGPGNRWLISEFGKAVPQPATSSLLLAAHKLVPNITDFQPLGESGMNGLNFAIIGSSYAYHNVVDNPDRISTASVQHLGNTMLSLAEHFGNLDVRRQPTAPDDAVFFALPGLGLVAYSERYVLPSQGALCLLFVASLAMGLRRKALTVGELLKGALAVIGSSMAAGAAVWVAYRLTAATARGPLANQYGGTYRQPLFDLGFGLLAGTVALLLYLWYRRHMTVRGLLAGTALITLLLGCIVAYFLPGVSYLFQWPLLGTGIALLCSYLAPDPDATWIKLLQFVPTATVVLLYGLAADALLLALPVALHFLVFGLLLLLAGGAVAPVLEAAAALGRWWLAAAGALGAAGFLMAAVLMSAPSAAQPLNGAAWYSLDADTGHAVWAVLAATPDDYTKQFLGGATRRVPISEIFPLQLPQPVTVADAAPAPLSAPSVTRVETGPGRLHLRVDFAPHAQMVYLRVSGGDLLAAAINGKAVKVPGALAQMGLQYATPADGFDLDLTAAGAAPLTVRVAAAYGQLPDVLSRPASPRPPYLMPGFDLDGMSLVSRTFAFDPSGK